MKDRRGPGIVAVSTAAGGGGVVGVAAETGLGEAAWSSSPGQMEEAIQRHRKTTKGRESVRRGNFIIGYLLRTFELRGSQIRCGTNPPRERRFAGTERRNCKFSTVMI
jgi:hypothetical protein